MSEAPAVATVDVFKGLPRRVQIGAFTFRIKVVSQDDPVLEDSDGMSTISTFAIYLHANLGQRLVEVVQHELTHCINWVYGLHEDGKTEEEFTTQHSKGLTEMWVRNPRLWNWFGKTLRTMRQEATHD